MYEKRASTTGDDGETQITETRNSITDEDVAIFGRYDPKKNMVTFQYGDFVKARSRAMYRWLNKWLNGGRY